MKFYENKTTSEIIGVENMRELITHPTESSQKLGFDNYSYQVIYDMICPNKILGNGINTFCITNSYLKANYVRINAKIALARYPVFKQYRHSDLQPESEKCGLTTLEIIHNQTF